MNPIGRDSSGRTPGQFVHDNAAFDAMTGKDPDGFAQCRFGADAADRFQPMLEAAEADLPQPQRIGVAEIRDSYLARVKQELAENAMAGVNYGGTVPAVPPSPLRRWADKAVQVATVLGDPPAAVEDLSDRQFDAMRAVLGAGLAIVALGAVLIYALASVPGAAS